jgi:hypothetical protein
MPTASTGIVQLPFVPRQMGRAEPRRGEPPAPAATQFVESPQGERSLLCAPLDGRDEPTVVVRVGGRVHHGQRAVVGKRFERGEEARLPDARLTLDVDEPTASGAEGADGRGEQVELGDASHECEAHGRRA